MGLPIVWKPILILLFYWMDIFLFEKLHTDGVVSEPSLKNVKSAPLNNFSLYWEIKIILYLGVLLLSSGIGILVYKNINTIGHQAILFFTALISSSCFYYCFKKKLPFSLQKVESPNSFFDYILLLGCLTFILFLGYLQFKYSVFGTRFGVATFVPMVVLFFTAYYFDQLSILSMAITNLAAWVGLVVTPVKILNGNDFYSNTLIITALLLGVALIITGFATKSKNIKAHFEFTYTNFGAHIFYIACIAAMLKFDIPHIIWLIIMAGVSYFFYLKAVKEKSFYFLLILTLYLYVGLTIVVISMISFTNEGAFYFTFLYFILSAIGLVVLLLKMNKKLSNYDSL